MIITSSKIDALAAHSTHPKILKHLIPGGDNVPRSHLETFRERVCSEAWITRQAFSPDSTPLYRRASTENTPDASYQKATIFLQATEREIEERKAPSRPSKPAKQAFLARLALELSSLLLLGG